MSEQKRAILAITGMTCATCALRIEKGLSKVEGVSLAQVNLATEKATVEYAPGAVEDGQFEKLIEDLGYHAILESAGDEQELAMDAEERERKRKRREIRRMGVSFAVSAALSLPLLAAMFAGLFGIQALMFLHNPVVQLMRDPFSLSLLGGQELSRELPQLVFGFCQGFFRSRPCCNIP